LGSGKPTEITPGYRTTEVQPTIPPAAHIPHSTLQQFNTQNKPKPVHKKIQDPHLVTTYAKNSLKSESTSNKKTKRLESKQIITPSNSAFKRSDKALHNCNPYQHPTITLNTEIPYITKTYQQEPTTTQTNEITNFFIQKPGKTKNKHKIQTDIPPSIPSNKT